MLRSKLNVTHNFRGATLALASHCTSNKGRRVVILSCHEGVSQRSLLHRLAKVTVHLASTTEHALHTSTGGWHGKELKSHVGKAGEGVLVLSPPSQNVNC
jgi:hypothetical protein